MEDVILARRTVFGMVKARTNVCGRGGERDSSQPGIVAPERRVGQLRVEIFRVEILTNPFQ